MPAGRKTVRFPKLTTNGFLNSILFKPEPNFKNLPDLSGQIVFHRQNP
ncbi:hypothetical protein [Moraxella lacunata]